MRNFVIDISNYAKSMSPGFLIIPQNGQELITIDGESGSNISQSYINSIDALGRENLFYAYDNDNIATPLAETNYMIEFLDVAKNNGKKMLVTDYCYTNSKIDDSFNKNYLESYISFAATYRELDNIPDYPATPYNENPNIINILDDAENFLYLINPGEIIINKIL